MVPAMTLPARFAVVALAGGLAACATGVVPPSTAPAGSPAGATARPVAVPETVRFPSADGTTTLVGYLFRPAMGAQPVADGARRPAVVMLHGRAGPYLSTVKDRCGRVDGEVASPCGAATLSSRHRAWGEAWAARGYLALHVDSFGPRGKGHGFGRFTHGSPAREDANERTVRPRDAEGALTWLRARPDVAPDRVFLHGWSNGGSTVLNTLHRQGDAPGFRAAVAFYPGCGPRALLTLDLRIAAPLTVFLGSADDETPPAACLALLGRARAPGAEGDTVLYDGAVHDFDNPNPRVQAVAANRAAREDAVRRAQAFFARFGGEAP